MCHLIWRSDDAGPGCKAALWIGERPALEVDGQSWLALVSLGAV